MVLIYYYHVFVLEYNHLLQSFNAFLSSLFISDLVLCRIFHIFIIDILFYTFKVAYLIAFFDLVLTVFVYKSRFTFFFVIIYLITRISILENEDLLGSDEFLGSWPGSVELTHQVLIQSLILKVQWNILYCIFIR